jgi:FkbM family methyltransferase
MFHIRRKLNHASRAVLNRLFKLDLVPLTGNETLHSHLREVIGSHRITTVLDVGANAGQFAAALRQSGFGGDIHSFEPVKATFDKLAANAYGDKRWFAHNMALGEAPGHAIIHVFAQSDFSSILPANGWGEDRFVGMRQSREEEIAIDTLDNFLRREIPDAQERILLKMDTQGYDLKVFEGARGALDRIAALLSEISLIPIYDGMPHHTATLEIYESAGYRISGLYPVTRNSDLSLVEMDCVLVRPAAAR